MHALGAPILDMQTTTVTVLQTCKFVFQTPPEETNHWVHPHLPKQKSLNSAKYVHLFHFPSKVWSKQCQFLAFMRDVIAAENLILLALSKEAAILSVTQANKKFEIKIKAQFCQCFLLKCKHWDQPAAKFYNTRYRYKKGHVYILLSCSMTANFWSPLLKVIGPF